MTMALVSQEKQNNYEDQVNNIIITFQMQKVTINGTQGYFIPQAGYDQMRYILNDYVYCLDVIKIKTERIQQLERLEIVNFRLKTALGITISIDVGSLFLCAGLGILTYNLAKGGY